VSVLFSNSLQDIDVKIYNSDGTKLAQSISVTDNEFVVFTPPSTGDIYILVLGWYSDRSAPYQLLVEEDCPTTQPISSTFPSTTEEVKTISGRDNREITIPVHTSCKHTFDFCLSVSGNKKPFSFALSGGSTTSTSSKKKKGGKSSGTKYVSTTVPKNSTRCISYQKSLQDGETIKLSIAGKGSWVLEYDTLEISNSEDCRL
jgi:hypothetical protein